MTTVAWRGSVLASDSAVTQDNRQTSCTKMLRMPGVAYGFAGDLSEIWHFVEKVKAGTPLEKIKLKGEFECLMLRPDGCFFMSSDLRPSPVEGEYWAIGSGAEYALGAMFYGKTARQGVAAAIAHDPHTAGEIRAYRITQRR